MSAGFSAVRRAGRWRIARSAPAVPTTDDAAALRRALAAGQALALQAYRSLDESLGVWRLELPKACLGDGELVLGLAADLARRCVAAPDLEHRLDAPARSLSRRAVVRALQAEGERVAGAWWHDLTDVAAFAFATAIAALLWLGTALRAIGDAGRAPRRADLLVAVHGEWSNRTRHALALVATGAAAPALLVLGRPRSRLATLRERWSRELGGAPVDAFRPFGPWSALAALPQGVALCAGASRAVAAQRYLPGFAAQVAMAYRCFLGVASARWWAAGSLAPRSVVYGHTGLADTTLLERAQQARGVRTVHAVHGVSGGLNFVGRSDLAVFRCAADARRHRELGGYGSCVARVAPRPRCRGGGDGLLLLSNLLHPMSPAYRAFGARDELWALEQVAAAADGLGLARATVAWRPHPVFGGLPRAVRERASARAAELGLRRAPEGPLAPLVEEVGLVVTTRSTVALDLLAQGVLPIVLETETDAEAAMDALAAFPLRARDHRGIVAAAARWRDAADREASFAACWDAVGPSLPLGAADCEA